MWWAICRLFAARRVRVAADVRTPVVSRAVFVSHRVNGRIDIVRLHFLCAALGSDRTGIVRKRRAGAPACATAAAGYG